MDLSWIKWPIILGIIAFLIWAILFGGSAVLLDKWFQTHTAATVGDDPERDKFDEAGLTKLADWWLLTLRYPQAAHVLETSNQRYPNGEHIYLNYYRLAKCYEKMGRMAEAVNILENLIRNRAWEYDSSIPEEANLRLRADKLIEVHGLRN